LAKNPESQSGEGARLAQYFDALREVVPSLAALDDDSFTETRGRGKKRSALVTKRYQKRMKKALAKG
jgi:hypothetical protein